MNVRLPGTARAASYTRLALGSLALVSLALSGCDPLQPLDVGQAQIEVRLTDAASTYLETMDVDIGNVAIVPLGGATIDLSADGTTAPVDLIRLHGQTPLQIAIQDVDPGPYTQLRIELESASLLLDANYAFTDGTRERDLEVPTTGISLNLDVAGIEDDSVGSLIVQAGQLVLLVDVDVNQSVLFQGDPESPDGIQNVLFDPKLRVVAQSAGGSISGTVYTGVSGVDPEGLLVTARPLSSGVLGQYQTQAATALTDVDGHFTIPYLPAARYAVNVEVPTGYYTDPGITESVVNTSSQVSGVDFDILVEPGG